MVPEVWYEFLEWAAEHDRVIFYDGRPVRAGVITVEKCGVEYRMFVRSANGHHHFISFELHDIYLVGAVIRGFLTLDLLEPSEKMHMDTILKGLGSL